MNCSTILPRLAQKELPQRQLQLFRSSIRYFKDNFSQSKKQLIYQV